MKSAVKIVRSLQADAETVSAMFLGYFVLLAVSALLIFGEAGSAHAQVASSEVQTQQANVN